jgi:hypothetical protein
MTSWRTSSKFLLSAKDAMLPLLPVKKLSRQTTSSPSARSLSQKMGAEEAGKA